MKYRFVKDNRNRYSITKMTTLFGISRGAYYQWLKSGATNRREAEEKKLVELIREIQKIHKGNYGTPRIQIELRKKYEIYVSRKRIAKLLVTYGLQSRRRRKYMVTTNCKHGFAICENILNREFFCDQAGKKWISDITYLRTRTGWLYLTTVIDLFDRKVIGWAISKTMEAEDTVVKAYQMACGNRHPEAELIFHSDRGIQYCAEIFRKALKQGCPTVQQSMSRKGNCWDNACAESFFKTLKTELETLNGKYGADEVRDSVFEYIEVYYNRKRMHSSLDYSVPAELLRTQVA